MHNVLSYKFSPESLHVIQVVVEGYHDKLMSLTEKIVEKMLNFRMKEDRFAFVKVRSRNPLSLPSVFNLNLH